MFKRTGPNIIENDEGISVEVLGRVGMRYTEAGRFINVDSEVMATPEIAIYTASIRNWSDGDIIDNATRDRIIQNIREAIQSQGEDIAVI